MHTPRPWIVRETGHTTLPYGIDGHTGVDGYWLARVWREEDARLIAAAPELEEWLTLALEGLAAYFEYGQRMREIGRGFDWGDVPGASTDTFIKGARILLARIAGERE